MPYLCNHFTIESPRNILFSGVFFVVSIAFTDSSRTFCFWFPERCFAVLLLEVMSFKRFSVINCLLRSSCNKRKLLLSSNTTFSSSAFRPYTFVYHFYLYFVLHQEVPVLQNSVTDWQTKVLKLVNFSYRRSISKRGNIEQLSFAGIFCHRPVKLRYHPVECFSYCMSQLCRNPFHC